MLKKPIAVLFASLMLATPLTASAQLTKEVRAELLTHTDELKENSDPVARQATVMALGRLLDRKDRKALEALRTDEDERVRLAAGMALMIAGERGAAAALATDLASSPTLYRTLREVTSALPDDLEVALLNEFLKKAPAEAKRDVYRYLAGQTGALYEVLGGVLTGKDVDDRRVAMEAVVFTARPETLKFARTMVASRDEAVRLAGVHIAAALKTHPEATADAVALLEGALADRSAGVVDVAARNLVEVHNRKGAEALVKSLAGLEVPARRPTIEFLLANDVRPALDAVKPLLEGTEELEDRALAYELAAATRDPGIFEELKKKFSSDNFDERIVAVRALGRAKNPEAIELLGRGLFEGRTEIRQYSARGLGQIADEAALAPLRRALNGERVKEIRLEVIRAVGQIKHRDAVQALRFLVTDPDVDIKRQITASLRTLGMAEGTAALELLLRDRNIEVQWQAFLVALEIAPELGLRQASTMLRNPPDTFLTDLTQARLSSATRQTIFAQLIGHNDSRVRNQVLARSLTLGDAVLPAMRKLAAEARTPADFRRELVLTLAERRDAKDIPLFERLARESAPNDMPVIAAWALAHSPTKDMEATFRGLLGSKSPALRAIATYGMASIK